MTNVQLDNRTDDWMDEFEGQLAIDVYQTDDEVILKAPIAGVDKDALEISITDEVINIKGERNEKEEINKENYFAQECYWGAFSRSYILPVAVDAEKAVATMQKNGLLIIKMPKLQKTKTKVVDIKTEED